MARAARRTHLFLVLDGDGSVLYEGIDGVPYRGKLTKKIASDALVPVLAAMIEMDYLSLEKIPCAAKTDFPTAVLTLRLACVNTLRRRATATHAEMKGGSVPVEFGA